MQRCVIFLPPPSDLLVRTEAKSNWCFPARWANNKPVYRASGSWRAALHVGNFASVSVTIALRLQSDFPLVQNKRRSCLNIVVSMTPICTLRVFFLVSQGMYHCLQWSCYVREDYKLRKDHCCKRCSLSVSEDNLNESDTCIIDKSVASSPYILLSLSVTFL